MDKTAKIITALAILATLAFGAWIGDRIEKYVSFEMNCVQYLKRAADANTVDLAKEQLEKAISYAESNGLTEGVVSIFLHQPSNDVGFWFRNLKEAYSELQNLPENTSSLEKTNVLMKLRESLTDESDSGVSVTVPDGITIFPHNVLYFWWGALSFVLAIGLWISKAIVEAR